jgi:hypothetical protein
LSIDLGQEQSFPVLSTVYIAGPQLRRHTIALAVERNSG